MCVLLLFFSFFDYHLFDCPANQSHCLVPETDQMAIFFYFFNNFNLWSAILTAFRAQIRCSSNIKMIICHRLSLSPLASPPPETLKKINDNDNNSKMDPFANPKESNFFSTPKRHFKDIVFCFLLLIIIIIIIIIIITFLDFYTKIFRLSSKFFSFLFVWRMDYNFGFWSR